VITLERMVFPEPVISQAVEPKTRSTGKRWAWRSDVVARKISFRVRTRRNRADHHLGMGELHLEIIVDA